MHPEKDEKAAPKTAAAPDPTTGLSAPSGPAAQSFRQLSAGASKPATPPGAAERVAEGEKAPPRRKPYGDLTPSSLEGVDLDPSFDSLDGPSLTAKTNKSLDEYVAVHKAGNAKPPSTIQKTAGQKALEALDKIYSPARRAEAWSLPQSGLLPVGAQAEAKARLERAKSHANVGELDKAHHATRELDRMNKALRGPKASPGPEINAIYLKETVDLAFPDEGAAAAAAKIAMKSADPELHAAVAEKAKYSGGNFGAPGAAAMADTQNDTAPAPTPEPKTETEPDWSRPPNLRRSQPEFVARVARADGLSATDVPLEGEGYDGDRSGASVASEEGADAPKASPASLQDSLELFDLSEATRRRIDLLVLPHLARPARDDADPLAEPLEASGLATALRLEQALREQGVSETAIASALTAAMPLIRRRIEEELELSFELERLRSDAAITPIKRRGVPPRGPLAAAGPGHMSEINALRINIAAQLREIRRLDPNWREPASAWPQVYTPGQVIQQGAIRLRSLQNTRWELETAALAKQFAHFGPSGQTIAANIAAGVRNPYYIGSHRDLAALRDRSVFGFPLEIHHLNQTAMMGRRVRRSDGTSVTALGNPTRGAPAEHMTWHRLMEKNLFRNFRPGGAEFGRKPTFREYNRAAADSYREAGFPSAVIRRLIDALQREQRALGYRETDPLPYLPGPVRVPKRHQR